MNIYMYPSFWFFDIYVRIGERYYTSSENGTIGRDFILKLNGEHGSSH